ncbi:MAG: hypothetical protein AAF483_19955 [Planctomycetota bacterium]
MSSLPLAAAQDVLDSRATTDAVRLQRYKLIANLSAAPEQISTRTLERSSRKFIEYLNSEDPILAVQVLRLLAAVDSTGLKVPSKLGEAVLPFLDHSDHSTRSFAIAALVPLVQAGFALPLENFSVQSGRMRSGKVQVLAKTNKLTDQQVVEFVQDEDPRVRSALALVTPKSKKALEAKLQLLQDSELAVRVQVFRKLVLTTPDEYAPATVAALKEALLDPGNDRHAVKSLGQFGTLAQSAILDIVDTCRWQEIEQGISPLVNTPTLDSLRQIGPPIAADLEKLKEYICGEDAVKITCALQIMLASEIEYPSLADDVLKSMTRVNKSLPIMQKLARQLHWERTQDVKQLVALRKGLDGVEDFATRLPEQQISSMVNLLFASAQEPAWKYGLELALYCESLDAKWEQSLRERMFDSDSTDRALASAWSKSLNEESAREFLIAEHRAGRFNNIDLSAAVLRLQLVGSEIEDYLVAQLDDATETISPYQNPLVAVAQALYEIAEDKQDAFQLIMDNANVDEAWMLSKLARRVTDKSVFHASAILLMRSKDVSKRMAAISLLGSLGPAAKPQLAVVEEELFRLQKDAVHTNESWANEVVAVALYRISGKREFLDWAIEHTGRLEGFEDWSLDRNLNSLKAQLIRAADAASLFVELIDEQLDSPPAGGAAYGYYMQLEWIRLAIQSGDPDLRKRVEKIASGRDRYLGRLVQKELEADAKPRGKL